MKIKRLIASLVMAVCMAATVVCMTSCGTKYTVTLNRVGSEENYTLSVGKGKAVTMDMLVEAYREEFLLDTGFYMDNIFYTDEVCRTRFVGGVTSDITLYFRDYSPELYGEVIFDYNGEQYVIYRLLDTKLSAEDFTVSAYGRGTASDYAFYSDKEHTVPLDIGKTEVKEGDKRLYVKVTVYVADAD